MALHDASTPLSPDWWLLRLGRRLRERARVLEQRLRYYTGDHPLPQAAHQDPNTAAAFRAFQEKARTNLCRLPVVATVNRQQVIGVTDGDGRADSVAWRWWQDNRLDSRQKQLYRLVSSTGYGYAMAGPHRADPRRPLITVEHPSQVITESDPETGQERAGLKAWWDDIEGRGRATVYLPDRRFRYHTDTSARARTLAWGESSWTLVEDLPNPLGRVPIEPFERTPDLGVDPEPVFWQMRDIQDRINLSILNRMTAERYTAQQQVWATGSKPTKTVDPLTGLEVPQNPYSRGADGVWINENPEGKFGYIPPADVTGVLKTHEFDIRTAFLLTSTPAYYMPGDLVNVSTETIVALDTNHVAMVEELNTEIGEGLEALLAMAALVAGDERDFGGHEVRWKDPRQLNPAVVADMATKKKSIGYPLTMVAEDMGESPQRVDRLRIEAAGEQLMAAGQAASAGTPDMSGPLRVTIPDDLADLV